MGDVHGTGKNIFNQPINLERLNQVQLYSPITKFSNCSSIILSKLSKINFQNFFILITTYEFKMIGLSDFVFFFKYSIT